MDNKMRFLRGAVFFACLLLVASFFPSYIYYQNPRLTYAVLSLAVFLNTALFYFIEKNNLFNLSHSKFVTLFFAVVLPVAIMFPTKYPALNNRRVLIFFVFLLFVIISSLHKFFRINERQLFIILATLALITAVIWIQFMNPQGVIPGCPAASRLSQEELVAIAGQVPRSHSWAVIQILAVLGIGGWALYRYKD